MKDCQGADKELFQYVMYGHICRSSLLLPLWDCKWDRDRLYWYAIILQKVVNCFSDKTYTVTLLVARTEANVSSHNFTFMSCTECWKSASEALQNCLCASSTKRYNESVSLSIGNWLLSQIYSPCKLSIPTLNSINQKLLQTLIVILSSCCKLGSKDERHGKYTAEPNSI